MIFSKHHKPTKAFIGLLILSLCLMPLLGLHIHLPATHIGEELHSHATETHGFHIHASQHDNIDIEPGHPSDSPQVDLELETQLHKIIKILALFGLAFILLPVGIGRIIIRRHNYVSPFYKHFEIYCAMRRGPPA